MRIALLSLDGATAGHALCFALQRAEVEVLHFSTQVEREDVNIADGYILLNGDHSPSLLSALKIASAKGKPILGIAEGAEILINTGLVPGLPDNRKALSLIDNKNPSLPLDVKIRLSKDYQFNAFTRYLTPQHILSSQVSTPRGAFAIAPGLWGEVEAQGLHIFCYCDAQGELSPDPLINPTGSTHNIAALANKAGNVLAMIPHPETTLEGDAIILSMRDHISSGYVAEVAPLDYWPRG